MKFNNNFYGICLALSCLVTLICSSGCEDELNGNGSVQVTVKDQDERLSQAIVYIKKDIEIDTTAASLTTLSSHRTDASGEVTIHDLEPGTYYLFAKGRSLDDHADVRGIDSVTVVQRNRQNTYSVVVSTH